MKNILFVCNQNKLRSPTAEAVFKDEPELECRSAGLYPDATRPLSAELVAWADKIFVMEQDQRKKIKKRFKEALGSTNITCLSIPDDYDFMDEMLIQILKEKVPDFL